MWFLGVLTWVFSADRIALFDQPGPRQCGMVGWQSAHLPLDSPSALSFAASGVRERGWGEQQEASSALTFHSAMQEEQQRRDGEVACSALWKGISSSSIHVCFVQSIRSPSTHSPISHLCQHRSA